MEEITTLLPFLTSVLSATQFRQLCRIVAALLSMTGRVTMLGLSRWGGAGASYRTITRFYHTPLPWDQMMWLLFRHRLYRPGQRYLLVGDETVVTKSGHKTHGIDRFFSSLYARRVRGVSFFALSLVGVDEEVAQPLLLEQVLPQPKSKTSKTSKTSVPAVRAKRGQGKDKTQIEWTEELRRLERLGQRALGLCQGQLELGYCVLDGHFGHNAVLQVVRQKLGLHLISKLRNDSELYFVYEGAQKAQGRRRIYGKRLDVQALPLECRVSCEHEKGLCSEVYQARLRHKLFPCAVNVVILVKTNLQNAKRAHALLFSSDLELSAEELVKFYRLRYQIEFNFRDAKQFWGLEDWMNIGATAVSNAAHLSWFMVSVSHCLLERLRACPGAHRKAGVLDLKAYWRGRYYAQATLKWLVQKPTPALREQIIQHVATQGAIHAQSTPCHTP